MSCEDISTTLLVQRLRMHACVVGFPLSFNVSALRTFQTRDLHIDTAKCGRVTLCSATFPDV